MKLKSSFSLKSGCIIGAFSIIVTFAFCLIIVLSQKVAATSSSTGRVYYLLESAEILGSGAYTGAPHIAPSNIITESQLYSDSMGFYISHLFPMAIIFCFFLFFSALLVWSLLMRLQKNQIENMTSSILNLNSDTPYIPNFSEAVDHLRSQFQTNLDDYKRLNSYLSHEQKNALAILRANMELSPNPVYLKNLDYLAASIDDILTLAETQNNEALESVDVSLICASVCDSYKKLTDKIRFFFDEDSDTIVIAKHRWIYRAISNLVDNAIKYGLNRHIEVSVYAEKGSVIVKVKDYGIGIAPEKQELIFNNRYRISEQKNDGYGIGLSLVSHVCDLCGGFIYLESEISMGSTFYLALPQSVPD